MAIGVAVAFGVLCASSPADQRLLNLAAIYALSCVGCHGPELDGIGAFPVLTGVAFQERWDGRPLDDLVAFVSQNMPLGAGGSLSTDTYAALVAYILVRNGAEPGETALDPVGEDALGVTLAFAE